jgi:guanosine-diphosphatase
MLAARLIDNRHHSSEDAASPSSTSSATSHTRSLSSRASTNQPEAHTHSPNRPQTKPKSKTMAILSRSPTTNNYERLEGGMSPLVPHAKWKVAWTWRRFAICAATLIGLVWFVGPRANSLTGHGSKEQWGLPVKGGDYRESPPKNFFEEV